MRGGRDTSVGDTDGFAGGAGGASCGATDGGASLVAKAGCGGVACEKADVVEIASVVDDTAGCACGLGTDGQAKRERRGDLRTDLTGFANPLCIGRCAGSIAMSVTDVWIVANTSRTRSAGGVGGTLFFCLGGDTAGVLAGLPAWAGLCCATLFGGACPGLAILRVFAIAVGRASAWATACTLEVGASFTCCTGQSDGGVALFCDTPATFAKLGTQTARVVGTCATDTTA